MYPLKKEDFTAQFAKSGIPPSTRWTDAITPPSGYLLIVDHPCKSHDYYSGSTASTFTIDRSMSGWSKDVRNIWSAPISALGVLCYATQCMYGAIRTRFETSLGYDAQVDQSMDTNLVALQPRWPKNTYMGATPDNAVVGSECLRAMAGSH